MTSGLRRFQWAAHQVLLMLQGARQLLDAAAEADAQGRSSEAASLRKRACTFGGQEAELCECATGDPHRPVFHIMPVRRRVSGLGCEASPRA